MKAIILALVVSGCAGMGDLPTVQNCEMVRYERNERKVRIEADCTVPLGGVPLGLK
jgi:hypothetical protein